MITVCGRPEKGHVAQPLDFSGTVWFKIVNVENMQKNSHVENQVLYKDSTQESKEGLDWEQVCLKKNEILTQI